jgi:serine/threonine protein kinase
MGQIGRYNVERLLARGGMAEVYLGKAEGPGGFSKVVVIKRILPELAEDPQFVEMFLSEARLAAQLSHPNVVQVFDFGEHEGQYYLAMEYVRGETLRSIVRAHQKLGKSLAPELAVRAVIGVCEGLHYAHELCDEAGESRNIVHRDVTPDNIIVSSGGVPKLLDFGIAKAATNVHRTAAGTVKGKYAYMSPELIRGDDVGRQLDVYALGVTMYELLSLKRPFESSTEMGLMKVILDGAARPLVELVGLDPSLSQIVGLAMHPAPGGRYADAHELQLALEDWLAASGKKPGTTELAAVVAEVTRMRGGTNTSLGRLEQVRGTPVSGVRHASGVKPLSAELASPPSAPTAASSGVRHTSGAGKLPFARGADVLTVVGQPLEVRQQSRGKLIGAVTAVAVLMAGAGAYFVQSADASIEPVVVVRPPEVPPAPKEAVAVEPPKAAVVPAPAPVVKVAGLREKTAETSPRPPVKSGEDGYLTLRTDPWCDVYLGSEKLGTTPLVRTPLPSGRLTLVLRNPKAGANRKLNVVVEPGRELKQTLVMPQGTIEFGSAPGTEVSLDGHSLGTTPLEPLDVVEGKHELRLGGVTRTLKVKAGSRETIK